MSTWSLAWRIVGTLLALALVCLLAWALLRWINRLQPGMSGSSKRLIRILDRVSVSKNQSLLLVRVQNAVMLVAFNEHTAVKLAEFDAAKGGFDPETSSDTPPSFSSALRDTLSRAGFSPFGKKDGRNGGGHNGE